MKPIGQRHPFSTIVPLMLGILLFIARPVTAADPQRVVALELSFVDALALVDIAPVGIADDNQPSKLIPALRERIGDWQSVGSRSQPSLELIAELQPDLIIADSSRHGEIIDDLQQLAPALLLPSKGTTYEQNLETLQQIGDAVGRGKMMRERLAQHRQRMEQYRNKLTGHKESVQFAIASDKGLWLHSGNSYAGSLIEALGLHTPINNGNAQPYIPTGLEQLLKVNPDWLLVGRYSEHTLLDKWQQMPLFSLLTAHQEQRIVDVSSTLWSLSRGVIAAEQMAEQLDHLLNRQESALLSRTANGN
ncbi:ABC transporter substrate-binding protein [Marinobacterium sp. D7]|uniref:Fe(3+) dicitrate ABC transporter substrate-binding protein n=1 Tax=Marinobacterium ramblicola TaxID=2849041 RepID=UPI001C2DD704|nr:Fe(3+) dicitrate ABC transporter substrate-binding protein [Marinobacterium ramblicola]MBV1789627.1 ABC transporter substrate-binding protein [Marinobacterium ramblicola]